MLMNARQPPANVTMRLRVITHADHTCAHANLDISEMGGIVQVPSIVLKASRLLSISILCFYFGNRNAYDFSGYFIRFFSVSF